MLEPTPLQNRQALSPTCKGTLFTQIEKRQLGFKSYVGACNDIASTLYSQINLYNKLSNSNNSHGGIFNLEFSKDGGLLLAACEKNCVLMYDTQSQKLIKTLEDAHNSCVNCVRFLTDRQFATCSDDHSIKIWDTRRLKHESFALQGHSNWVKNIEFLERQNLLVTSAFDGGICTWDLNKLKETGVVPHNKIFFMDGLMRTKLSLDGTKMVISTTGGYLIIIHDLDLNRLDADLKGFRPFLYRFMQANETFLPACLQYNEYFDSSRRRNRVEFIDDFPFEADVISSLQIHPHGWNCVSRSLSCTLTKEVTCVHDIQHREPTFETCERFFDDKDLFLAGAEADGEGEAEDGEREVEEAERNPRPTDLWSGYTANSQYVAEGESRHPPAMGMMHTGLIARNGIDRMYQQDVYNKVVVNLKRLTHSIAEKNVGQGYIKELCYSSDGRVICSPYERGVRLLGFSENYQELTYCVPDEATSLVSLMEMENYHQKIVVSCKFSPTDMLLVSGCLSGEICWYKPVL